MSFPPNPEVIVPLESAGSKAEASRELLRGYLEEFSSGRLVKPARCECCGRRGALIWHGSYRRAVVMLCGRQVVPVKRVRCKRCGGTFAVLPGFILKRRRYGADVILVALSEKKRRSYEQVVSELSRRYGLLVDVLTVWLWCKAISPRSLRRLRELLVTP